MKKTRSVHELRRGYLIVRIWRKKTRSGIRHTVSVIRLFRNGDTWKESTRFGCTDIPLLRLLLNEAHTWICLNVEQIRSTIESTRTEC